MSTTIAGVVLLPTGGASAGPPVDLIIEKGVIAAIVPAASAPERRRLALPALVNAHDHARPLSPTSFGAAGKPLETWLLRLAAMPAIDPYLGALAAFGRAARAGAGSVMAHYTRFHGPMPPVDEGREIARAAAASVELVVAPQTEAPFVQVEQFFITCPQTRLPLRRKREIRSGLVNPLGRVYSSHVCGRKHGKRQLNYYFKPS